MLYYSLSYRSSLFFSLVYSLLFSLVYNLAFSLDKVGIYNTSNLYSMFL